MRWITLGVFVFVLSRLWALQEMGTGGNDIFRYAKMGYLIQESLTNSDPFYTRFANHYTTRNSSLHPWQSQVEYPPFAIYMVMIPSLLISYFHKDIYFVKYLKNYPRYFHYMSFFLELLMLLLIIFLAKNLSVSPPNIFGITLFFAMIGITQVDLLYNRLDMILAFFIFVSLFFLCKYSNYTLSFLILSLGIHFKLVPIVLVPLWILASMKVQTIQKGSSKLIFRELLQRFFTFIGFIFIPLGIFYMLEDRHIFDFFSFHHSRPIQLETLYSSLLSLASHFGYPTGVGYTHYSFSIAASLEPAIRNSIPLILFGANILLLWFFTRIFWRKNKTQRLFKTHKTLAEAHPRLLIIATTTTLMTNIIFSKVFSPQYIIWLFPLIPLCLYKPKAKTFIFYACFLAICLLTAAIFPEYYAQEIRNYGYGPTVFGTTLLLSRNLMFFVIIAQLLVEFKKSLTLKSP